MAPVKPSYMRVTARDKPKSGIIYNEAIKKEKIMGYDILNAFKVLFKDFRNFKDSSLKFSGNFLVRGGAARRKYCPI